jgi:hypothetical protein
MIAAPGYFLSLERLPEPNETASFVFPAVFRTGFEEPGFALISLPDSVSSSDLRRFMVALKDGLSAQYHARTGRHLTYLSLLRFDQQNTTRFHRDGGPDESYLILGYEPSVVQSIVRIADYSRAAHDLGITPTAFLKDYNPLFPDGARVLLPYTTELRAFHAARANILIINNSCLPLDGSGFPGILHQATIPTPIQGARRVINSTMLVPTDTPETPDMRQRQADFLIRETLDEG